MNHRLLWIIPALVSATLCGCSGYQDPSVRIVGASVIETSREAMTLHIAADLSNPNDEPLKLLSFSYQVKMDGLKVYQGERAAEATLAANEQRQVIIPAVIRFADAGGSVAAPPANIIYSISGSLQYITPGEIAQILFDSGVRKPKAGFQGNVLLDIPPQLSQAMASD